MYNADGDDDDCKYHVHWTSSPVQRGTDVSITVTLTAKADGAPVAGADPYADVFLSQTHPGGMADERTTEIGQGRYLIQPVRFDALGRWTMRFHVFSTCSDLPDSPHGHAAFFIDVP
jgi:hypothetical protein